MAESTDAIDSAIQSAESLFASLLDRSPTHVSSDPESSLLPSEIPPLTTSNAPISPESSIASIGMASLGPGHLTAHTHAVYEDFDPRESLYAIVNRSQTSLTERQSYESLQKLLADKEKDLTLAAQIGASLLKRNELLETDLGSVIDNRQLLEQQVAQLKHSLLQKEELLKLYARDAAQRDQDEAEAEGHEENPEWVVALTEECKELKESNDTLRMEADQLRQETAEVESKERDLVKKCLEQFSEAKRQLSEMRERAEESYSENQELQAQNEQLEEAYQQELVRRQQLFEDGEILKEQYSEAQFTISHLTNELSEANDRYATITVQLKEANDELNALNEISLQPSATPPEGSGGEEQHESIVKEIEEALRREIHAASTLTERPMSPNHYARQRTMVVMETVKAATLATARRLERLSTEAKLKTSGEGNSSTLKPVASSSPADLASKRLAKPRPSPLSRLTPSRLTKAPSPISSKETSPVSLSGDRPKYGTGYTAPQKLQIVKPMEGSVTLLKWKLLATPQLGGAKSFFSKSTSPGVHLKEWHASGIKDLNVDDLSDDSGSHDPRMTVSAMDLRELGNMTYPPAKPHVRRPRATPIQRPHPPQSTSLLGQVGNFFSSRFRSSSQAETSTETDGANSSQPTTEGLGGLL